MLKTKTKSDTKKNHFHYLTVTLKLFSFSRRSFLKFEWSEDETHDQEKKTLRNTS